MTREEAIKEFESELKWAELNTYPYVSKQKIEADKMAIKALEEEPKIGHWIHIEKECSSDPWPILKCSCCGSQHLKRRKDNNYCTVCGARMVESDE